MRQVSGLLPGSPMLPQVDLNVSVRRVVDDWVPFSIFRPDQMQWVHVFVDVRFASGGQNLGFWTRRGGKVVWLLRNSQGFAPVPVTHWKPLGPDPE